MLPEGVLTVSEVLVDRWSRERGDWVVNLKRIELGKPPRPLAFYGPSSASISALLADLVRLSDQAGWQFQSVDAYQGESLADRFGLAPAQLDDHIRHICDHLPDDTSGLAVIIDGAQHLASIELSAVCIAAHQAAQRCWPFALAIGGDASLPRQAGEARPYGDALFDYHRIS